MWQTEMGVPNCLGKSGAEDGAGHPRSGGRSGDQSDVVFVLW